MNKPALVLVVALAAPLAVGCGGDDASDEDQVRDVIELVNARDPAVCDKLTATYKRVRAIEERRTCERRARRTRRNAVDVERISVDGDRATVSGTIEGRAGELLLIKEGDDWKLDSVEVGR